MCLIRSLTHNESGYKFPLKDSEKQLVVLIKSKLSSSEHVQESLHLLLLSLLRVPSEQSISQKWTCSLLCYLAVDNLRVDGTFNDAHNVTSSLAHWEYIRRSVALQESYNSVFRFDNDILK